MEGSGVMEKGNILASAWGYGARNISFYVVTAVSAKGRVKISPIGKERVKVSGGTSDADYDEVKPVLSGILKETGYKMVMEDPEGKYIKIANWERARKVCENAEEAATYTNYETNSAFI